MNEVANIADSSTRFTAKFSSEASTGYWHLQISSHYLLLPSTQCQPIWVAKSRFYWSLHIQQENGIDKV